MADVEAVQHRDTVTELTFKYHAQDHCGPLLFHHGCTKTHITYKYIVFSQSFQNLIKAAKVFSEELMLETF